MVFGHEFDAVHLNIKLIQCSFSFQLLQRVVEVINTVSNMWSDLLTGTCSKFLHVDISLNKFQRA